MYAMKKIVRWIVVVVILALTVTGAMTWGSEAAGDGLEVPENAAMYPVESPYVMEEQHAVNDPFIDIHDLDAENNNPEGNEFTITTDPAQPEDLSLIDTETTHDDLWNFEESLPQEVPLERNNMQALNEPENAELAGSLVIQTSYNDRGIYETERNVYFHLQVTQGEDVYTDTLPVLICKNAEDSAGTINNVYYYSDSGYYSIGIPMGGYARIDLPDGAVYTLSYENMDPCFDVVWNGSTTSLQENGTVHAGSVDEIDVDFTIKLITIYFSKEIEGPDNGEWFELHFALGVQQGNDVLTVPLKYELNGEIREMIPVYGNYMRSFELFEKVHGGDVITIRDVPYGCYYFYEESDWYQLVNYRSITGFPGVPDGSSGYCLPNVVQDGVMRKAMTNRRFNYSHLTVTKTVEGEDIPEAEKEKSFSFVLTIVDNLVDGDVVTGETKPVQAEFPMTISDANGNSRETSIVTDAAGQAIFQLKNGETAYIGEMYSGTSYTVEELTDEKYNTVSGSQEYIDVGGNSYEKNGEVQFTAIPLQSGYIEYTRPAEVYFTNTYDPKEELEETVHSSVTISKTDADGNALDGATFVLQDDEETLVTTYTGAIFEICTEDPELEGYLPEAGETTTLHLQEIQAPEGYVLDDTAYEVMISSCVSRELVMEKHAFVTTTVYEITVEGQSAYTIENAEETTPEETSPEEPTQEETTPEETTEEISEEQTTKETSTEETTLVEPTTEEPTPGETTPSQPDVTLPQPTTSGQEPAEPQTPLQPEKPTVTTQPQTTVPQNPAETIATVPSGTTAAPVQSTTTTNASSGQRTPQTGDPSNAIFWAILGLAALMAASAALYAISRKGL